MKIIEKLEAEAAAIEDRIIKGKAKDWPDYQGLVNRARGLREAVVIVREGLKASVAGSED